VPGARWTPITYEPVDDVLEVELIGDRAVRYESREGPTPFRYVYAIDGSATGRGSRSTPTSRARDCPVRSPGSTASRRKRSSGGMQHNLERLQELVESTARAGGTR
jgi:hypothetical protein